MGVRRGEIMIGQLSWPRLVSLKSEPAVWSLISLASFLLFLFVTFPYSTMQTRILTEIARGTGWEVRAADWSPGLPLGIEWHEVTWSRPGGTAIPVQLMRFNVGLLGLLMGHQVIDGLVQFPGGGQTSGGRATARMDASSWSFQGPVSFKGQFKQVDLSAFVKPYVTRGLLEGDVMQRWENLGPQGMRFKGDGTWKAEIKELVLGQIPVGVGTLPSLSFSRVSLALSCHDAVCDVTEFKGDGPDGTIAAQGRVILQQPVQSSTLDLAVTVLPGAGWAQKAGNLPLPPLPPGTPLTFKLAGSVANPILTL